MGLRLLLSVVVASLTISTNAIASPPQKVNPVCNGLTSKEFSDLLRSRIVLIQDIALHTVSANSCDKSIEGFTMKYMQAMGFPVCEAEDDMTRVFSGIVDDLSERAGADDIGTSPFVYYTTEQIQMLSRISLSQNGGCDGLFPYIDEYLKERADR